jgi:hypothetical protein
MRLHDCSASLLYLFICLLLKQGSAYPCEAIAYTSQLGSLLACVAI